MNGYVIGGLACLFYAAFVYYIAIKKPPTMIKLVKMKINKKMSDKAAAITCYIFASVAVVGAIVLFAVSA